MPGLALLALSMVVAAHLQDSIPARIEVGPNILVSDDGIVPHIEPMAASDPTDSGVLVAVVTTQRETDLRAGAYASTDGGFTWTASTLPLQVVADPQVAIGKTGTVYFPVLARGPESIATLYVVRSEDHGVTWQPPVAVAPGQDHPQVVVDRSGGRFAGRIYIGTLYGETSKVGVFRSDDDGRSWDGPVEFIDGGATWGHNINNLLVLSDGTVFAPYFSWQLARPDDAPDSTYASFALSTDGGVTFTAEHPIRLLRVRRQREDTALKVREEFPEYAVAPPGTSHRDRIYMVLSQLIGRRTRLFLQYSDDRGATWSAPRAIDPGVPAHADQFQQMVAVNAAGVVGITWFDTRASKDGSGFDQYFTASADGGATFLPAVRVSTASTVPKSPANLRVMPLVFSDNDTLYLSMLNGAGRLTEGGDYMGLTADANGVFHPVWTDARSGTYQLYTAAICVTHDAGSMAAAPKPAVRQLRAEFTVLVDPTSYDPVRRILTIPLRVKNTGASRWYGPLTLRLDVNPGLGGPGGSGAYDARFYPTILGASNRKTGPGAEFDLTPLAGTAGTVAPGATTGALMLQLKVDDITGHLGSMTVFVSAAAE